ncbi:ribosomal protein L25 [[Synechococcus] sp. NIES-970]|uniref:50S ribosomal protein L25 n=1 Tax=Picosynechococcus sp. NKBG15041c TaxID=1407650 RepID=UPI0003FD47C4|nr:ribosomal protein L25 [[Synechococcus] sp. NIES-970]
MSLTIECQARPEGINPRALRRDGLLPVNLYGHKGADSDVFVVNYKEALNLLKKATPNETVIEVKTPGWSGSAVIREIQSHPWKRNLLHLSFFHTEAA